MIGCPFLPTVRLLESNVFATSKILTLSPLEGDAGRVTVNDPPEVLAKHCCLLASVTPEVASMLAYAPRGSQAAPL